MREVYVAGVGMMRFGRFPERPIEDMGREVVLKALEDAKVTGKQIQETFCGSGYGGPLLGQRILRDMGLTGMAITNVENACSSGTTALREGIAAVAMGRIDVALVIGIDKLTKFGGGTVPLETTDLEVGEGMVMPGLYAMRARRYMHEFGATPKHLGLVSVKAHKNGSRNPYAQYQKEVGLDEVLNSRMIADPLTMYMCCPTGDGAAAVVVTTGEKVRQLGVPSVKVLASTLQSGMYKTGFRDMAANELSARTCKLAYEQAGLSPKDVSLAEVHDVENDVRMPGVHTVADGRQVAGCVDHQLKEQMAGQNYNRGGQADSAIPQARAGGIDQQRQGHHHQESLKAARFFDQATISPDRSIILTTARVKGMMSISSSATVITVTASARFPLSRFCTPSMSGHVVTTIMVAQTSAVRKGRSIQKLAVMRMPMKSTARVVRAMSGLGFLTVIDAAPFIVIRQGRPACLLHLPVRQESPLVSGTTLHGWN